LDKNVGVREVGYRKNGTLDLYLPLRGYRISLFELIPDSNKISCLIIRKAQHKFKEIKGNLESELTKTGVSLVINKKEVKRETNTLIEKGDIVIFTPSVEEIMKKLEQLNLDVKIETVLISEFPLVVLNGLLSEFEKTLLSENFRLPKKYFAYIESRKKNHPCEDVLEIYEGIEYRIRFSKDILQNEGFFAIALDHHIFLKFKLSLYNIINNLKEKNYNHEDIEDLLIGLYMEEDCPINCRDIDTGKCALKFKRKRRISGYIRKILFPNDNQYNNVKNSLQVKKCPKLERYGSVQEPLILIVGEEGNISWESSLLLFPEPNLHNISNFIKVLKNDEEIAKEIISRIRQLSFLDTPSGQSNSYASRDRSDSILELIKIVLPSKRLQVGNVCFYLEHTPIEIQVYNSEVLHKWHAEFRE